MRRRIQSGNGRQFACCDFIQTKADSHAKTAGLSPSCPDGPRPHDAVRRDGLGTGMRGHVFRACLARCRPVLHRVPLIESVLPSRYPITILSDAQRQRGEWWPKEGWRTSKDHPASAHRPKGRLADQMVFTNDQHGACLWTFLARDLDETDFAAQVQVFKTLPAHTVSMEVDGSSVRRKDAPITRFRN